MENYGRYNQLTYWEKFLEKPNSFLGEETITSESTIFVNASLIARSNSLVSSQWLCFPNSYAALGFLQYIYFPTIFYHLFEETESLMVPLLTTDEVLSLVGSNETNYFPQLNQVLDACKKLWNLEEQECSVQLKQICSEFHLKVATYPEIKCQILFFDAAYQISEYVKRQIWSEEVFYEDFGCEYSWLENLCSNFTKAPFFRKRLLQFLNHRLGYLMY